MWAKPSGGGAEATKVLEVNSGAFVPDDVDCPTSSFCVLIGTESHNLGGGAFNWENAVVTLTNPVESSPSFTHHFIGDRTLLRALSCPTSSFCLAVDEEGNDLVSTAPSTAAWEPHFIDPNGALYESALLDVSCPSEEFCAAVGNSFEVLTSKQLFGGEEAWSHSYLEANEALACPSSSLCLAAGGENISVGTPAPPPAPEEEEKEEASGGSSSPAPPIKQPPIIPPPPRQPSLRLWGSRQIVVKNGKAVFLISCISSNGCTGGAKLFAAPAKSTSRRRITKSRAARIKIAVGKFTIGPNRTKRVVIALNRRGRKILPASRKTVAQLKLNCWSANERLSLRKGVVLREAK